MHEKDESEDEVDHDEKSGKREIEVFSLSSLVIFT